MRPDTNVGPSTDELIRCKQIDAFVAKLSNDTNDLEQVSDTVPWFEEGAVTEVDLVTFRQYVGATAFGPPVSDDGATRFLLFWKRSGRFFARQLTPAEAARLCQLLLPIVT